MSTIHVYESSSRLINHPYSVYIGPVVQQDVKGCASCFGVSTLTAISRAASFLILSICSKLGWRSHFKKVIDSYRIDLVMASCNTCATCMASVVLLMQ